MTNRHRNTTSAPECTDCSSATGNDPYRGPGRTRGVPPDSRRHAVRRARPRRRDLSRGCRVGGYVEKKCGGDLKAATELILRELRAAEDLAGLDKEEEADD